MPVCLRELGVLCVGFKCEFVSADVFAKNCGKTQDLFLFRIQIRLYAVEHRQSDRECRACLHIHGSDAAVVRSDNIIGH